jgi:hypothetical protein
MKKNKTVWSSNVVFGDFEKTRRATILVHLPFFCSYSTTDVV